MENSNPRHSRYICVDSNNIDTCISADVHLTAVRITLYLPLVMVPLISYLTIVYIYPVIYYCLKRHLQNSDNSFYIRQNVKVDSDEQLKAKVMLARKWKELHLQGLLATNCYIYFVLWLCIPPTQLIHYNNRGNSLLITTDHYVSYLHEILSIIVLVIIIGAVFLRCRNFSFISLICMSITVNIVYVMCYSIPRMLVGFTYGPLQATYNCCMAVVVIISSYPLTWYCLGLFMFSKLALKQAYLNLFSCKGLLHFLKVATMLLFYCICFITFAAIIEILGSDMNYQYLKILCLLASLLAICLFNPVHHYAYKYAIANAELMMLHVFNHDNYWMEDDGDRNNTVSYTSADQGFINQSTSNYCTNLKEKDGYLQSNENTIV